MTYQHLELQIDGIESHIRQLNYMIRNAESDTERKTLEYYKKESEELLVTLQNNR